MDTKPTEETQSQTIKSICDILEAFGLPESAVQKIRKKCWYLVDNKYTGSGNGKKIY